MNFYIKATFVLLTVVSESFGKPMENIDRMILRNQMDQDNAASYVYRSDNNGPPQIYYLTADGLSRTFRLHHPTPIVYQKTDPYTYSQPYASAYPISYYPPKSRSNLIVPHPQKVEVVEVDDSKDNSSSSESEESNENDHEESKSDVSNESQDKASQEEMYQKKNGKKTVDGYSKEFKYQKGKKGSYEKDLDSDDNSEEGDKKDSHYDEADKFQQNEEESEKKKTGDYGSKKHHKKGSKSKGYHNIFMKDEYKKDHTFYDTADHQGHYSKHGSENKKHYTDEGKEKKGSHHDSGSKESHHSKKDGSDKGHFEENEEGYEKKSGNNEKHSHSDKYGKKDGQDHHHLEQHSLEHNH